MDVVGVDKSKWTMDPFAATVKDGYLWGRGAIDDKGMLAANLATMVELKRAGVHLNRDVIFLADDDEEQGGAASIKLLIEKYWDKIACGFALNEGGRVVLKDGKVQYVGIQASEKVPYNVAVIATGVSGHASDSAAGQLRGTPGGGRAENWDDADAGTIDDNNPAVLRAIGANRG